jgi:hypothetical protein
MRRNRSLLRRKEVLSSGGNTEEMPDLGTPRRNLGSHAVAVYRD